MNIVRDRTVWFAALILTLVGGWFRLRQVGSQALYFFDEATTAYAVEGILQKGYPVFPSGMAYPRALLYLYLNALACLVFGYKEFSLRLVSVLFGTLSIPLGFIVGRKWLGREAGFWVSGLLAFSLWGIEFSRIARSYAQFQFFYLLSLFFFYKGFFEKQGRFKLWFMATAMLTALSHELGMTVLLSYPLFFVARGKRVFRDREWLLSGVGLGGTFALLFLVFKKWMEIRGGVEAAALQGMTMPRPVFLYLLGVSFPKMFCVSLIGMAVLMSHLSSPEKRDQALFLLGSFFLAHLAMGAGFSAHYETRYNFHLYPLFLLFYVCGLLWMARRVVKWCRVTAQAGKTAMVVLFLILTVDHISPLDAYAATQRRAGDPLNRWLSPSNWVTRYSEDRTSATFVRTSYRTGDLVIVENPHILRFYLDPVDYALYSSAPLVSGNGKRTRDYYTGVPLLEDQEDFENVIRGRDRVWVVFSRTGFYEPAAEKRLFREYVTSRGKLLFEGPARLTRVYLISKGKGNG